MVISRNRRCSRPRRMQRQQRQSSAAKGHIKCGSCGWCAPNTRKRQGHHGSPRPAWWGTFASKKSELTPSIAGTCSSSQRLSAARSANQSSTEKGGTGCLRRGRPCKGCQYMGEVLAPSPSEWSDRRRMRRTGSCFWELALRQQPLRS